MNRRFESYIPAILTLLIFGLVAGALIWTARANYRDFVASQREAMRHSVTSSSQEINLLLLGLRRGLSVLIDEHPKQLQALAHSSADRARHVDFVHDIHRHFPTSRGFALSNRRGQVLYDSAGLSRAGRDDLRGFALGRREDAAFIHGTPGRLHMDLMVPWRDHGVERGVLLVRFNLRRLTRLLHDSALHGHQLILVRDVSPDAVAASSTGLGKSASLMARMRIATSYPVAGTRWTLLDLPDSGLFTARAARERDQVLIAFSGIGLLWLMLIILLRRKEAQQLAAERALRDSHGQLERRVTERTRELRQSDEELKREATERCRAEWLRADQQAFMRLIAEGRPLAGTLERLARYVEQQLPDVRCTFAVQDEKGNLLRLTAAPNLPADFVAEMALVSVADPGPVSAVAAFRKSAVQVTDIATDPTVAAMRPVLEAAGVQACWAQPVLAADGQVLGTVSMLYGTRREPSDDEREVMAMLVDIAGIAIERSRAEARMRQLSGAIEQTDDLVVITDRDGIIEYVNPAFLATSGFARDEVIGRTPVISKSGLHDTESYRKMWQTILDGNVFRDVVINRRRDGSLYYEEKTITPLKDEAGTLTHFVSTGKDITERMEVQEHLHYLAHHDMLTGLPNRALLEDRLAHAIAQSERNGKRLAVLFFDLDRFKNVNDSLGHGFGDELLKAVVERVSECVRHGDTMARLAGDEFTLIMEGIDDVDDVVRVAEKILAAVSSPTPVGGHEIFVTASIGITVYPDDARDSDSLLKNADSAMYRAKDSGGNCYQFFTPDMTQGAVEYLRLQNQVHRALERGEFVLYYQPRVNMIDGRISGVEALLRWRHPEFGLVSPTQFIPLLEETGLILGVGEWVMETACAFSRALFEAVGGPLRIAVNLSTRQFRDSALASKVQRCLDRAGLAPELLELEITESLLADNMEQTVRTLRTLHAMGVRMTVDDFGTGYSSMSYLKSFPIACLKVDRSFVRDVPGDANDRGIVMAILALARSLGLQVTAEGVETEQQLAFVREHGCDEVQGYLIGRPMLPETLLAWVRGQHEPPSPSISRG